MSRPCEELELLIGRPTSSLSEASRLQLERHLGECADCLRTHTLARSIRGVVLTAANELPASDRERTIAAAFRRAETKRASVRPVRQGVWIAAAVAVAASVALGVRLMPQASQSERLAVQTRPAQSAAQVPAPAVPPLSKHVVAQASEASPAPPAAQSADADWLTLAADQERMFAQARVRGTPGTRVRFDAAERELTLDSGRIEVDVDPQPGASFAVITRSFRVQVLGTQFVVTPERVAVRRGRVQVLDLDGTVLAKDLGAGKHYDRSARSGTHTAEKRAGDAGETLAALLQQVRTALANHDLTLARALLLRASKRTGSRMEGAERGTLTAECALLEHQPERAIREYRAVADRYRELAAGENALFAAAQLSTRERDPSLSKALLEAYLARYPRGRFADEARTRLGKLAR